MKNSMYRLNKNYLLFAIVIIYLAGWTISNAAMAMGPELPVQLEFMDVKESAMNPLVGESAIDPSLSKIQIIPRDGNAIGATIKRVLYLEGEIFEVEFGKSFALDSASTVLTDDADLPRDVPDGYYYENVNVQVMQNGADLPLTVRASRYFYVEDGYYYPISSKEYTEAVTEYLLETGPDGEMEYNFQGAAMLSSDFQEKVATCKESPNSCAAVFESAGK